MRFLREFLLRRRLRREALSWARWYAAHPCRWSSDEPWFDGERKHSKGGL